MPPRDLQTWMWAEACEALTRAERLHRQFFRIGPSSTGPVWEPPIDIFETAGEVWILAALPGIEAPLAEILVEDGVLIIAGERPKPTSNRVAAIHRMEIPFGRFERRIALPPGRFELARRDLALGLLTIALRKLG
ncbi:MAG TPA: Hsp20/alpha crystallin family protein [Stellaceae bacterium]|nr:Hsp20/alpha crystallin family protein [Stellaceae bacterium]